MELQNEQYNLLYMEYTKRQNNARYELEQRYEEIINQIPSIKNLDASISDLSVRAASLALEGDDSSLQSLKQRISEIQRQKEILLTSNGYPADYLDKTFVCEDCQDTGYIGREKCHCFKKAIVDYLYVQSNIQDVLEVENFSHFCKDYYPDDYVENTTGLTPRDNINAILQTAYDFIKNFDKKPDNLLLYGSTGVGKTFLSHCIAKELLDQSHTVVYLTSPELFDILETYKFDYSQNAKQKNAHLSYITQCDLLIIDDLGTELNNTFVSSSLYQLIDTRLTMKYSTIISTNMSFDDLSSHYSERIFSRITSHYRLLKLTGNDIRLKKAMEKPNS